MVDKVFNCVFGGLLALSIVELVNSIGEQALTILRSLLP
jgi:hypothetical protein